jgi:hypothetical protein
MGTHTQPDITSPVTRGQSASTGVTQNIGTALGSAAAGSLSGGIGGFTNNSLGGSAYNGIQSANQIPTQRGPILTPTIAVVANPLEGGGSYSVSTSSVNPPSIQSDVKMYLQGQEVVTTDAQSTSVPAQGFGTVLPKSAAVELPTNTPNLAKHIQPAATIAAPTQISYKGDWASNVTGNPGAGNVLNNIAVATADANGPVTNWQNGAATFGQQALPANGNPSLPADGGPTSSIQVRSTNSEGTPNNSIPFDNGTADKP